MGILTRFKDIMSANINALLDKAENPEKMIDQYLRNMEEDFSSVKSETAAIMAEEKSAKRKLDDCNADIEKMVEYAKKAIAAGNEGEAKQFLTRKGELAEKQVVLQKQYDLAKGNADKMKEMHDKLEDDISALKSKRDMLKAKVKVAETQKKISSMGAGISSAGDNMAAFDRMEDKVNRMMDEADAMAELNSGKADSIDELAKKYASEETSSAVDDELAALKAQMGM